MQKTYPERIALARYILKETQKDFAGRFGLSKSLASLWESGKREAPYKVLLFVEQVLSKPKHLVDNG